jgi:hypothetical protein
MLIQRVDHVVAVVDDFEVARRAWIEARCPVVYDGVVSRHRACCVSIGAVNLELLSAEAFDGWPARQSWCAHAGRRPEWIAPHPGNLAGPGGTPSRSGVSKRGLADKHGDRRTVPYTFERAQSRRCPDFRSPGLFVA